LLNIKWFILSNIYIYQETAEKLQERAKRFGIQYKPEPPIQFDELYKR